MFRVTRRYHRNILREKVQHHLNSNFGRLEKKADLIWTRPHQCLAEKNRCQMQLPNTAQWYHQICLPMHSNLSQNIWSLYIFGTDWNQWRQTKLGLVTRKSVEKGRRPQWRNASMKAWRCDGLWQKRDRMRWEEGRRKKWSCVSFNCDLMHWFQSGFGGERLMCDKW